MSLKLVSVNVELTRHLDTVAGFLRAEHADIVCLQEVCESNIELFKEATGAVKHFYVPMSRVAIDGAPPQLQGVCLLSHHEDVAVDVAYYVGDPHEVPLTSTTDERTFGIGNYALIRARLEVGQELFQIATTHFVWSPRGEATDAQRHALQTLLTHVPSDIVLVGDFNAPRGGEIFSRLAALYTDNIPPEYKTSIDIPLHRAGKTSATELADKMVDGIFSSPEYRIADVRFSSGISDHLALSARVHRA